jgi:hypothetical protein
VNEAKLPLGLDSPPVLVADCGEARDQLWIGIVGAALFADDFKERGTGEVYFSERILAVSVRTYLTLRFSADVFPRFSWISNSTR